MNRLILLMLFLLQALFNARQAVAESRPTPGWNGGTVRVAIPRDFPPTYFQNPKTGKPDGFAIDIMNEIAGKAGLKIEYVFGKPWQEIDEMILDGRADLIPNLTINKDRKNLYSFTSPLETVQISLFALKSNADIKGLSPGLTVGAMRMSTAYYHIKNRQDLHLITYDSVHKLLFDLLAGQIDTALIAEPNLVKMALDAGVDDKIQVVGNPVLQSKRAMALRKSDTELLKRLDEAINGFVGSPRYIKIYQKWWSKPKPYWDTNHVIMVVVIAVLTVSIIMGGWRYTTIKQLNGKLNAALKSTEFERSKTQAILDSLNEGISIQDKDMRVVYQNPALTKIVGNHIGELCYQAYQRNETTCVGCPVWQTFIDGSPHMYTMPIKRRKTTEYYEIFSSPLRDESGEISLVIESVRNVTERVKAEEALVVKQQQLEALNEKLEDMVADELKKNRDKDRIMMHQGRLAAMGEMIGNIAHQWRQPLNNIGLLMYGIKVDYDDGTLDSASLQRQINVCMDLVQYMSRTIDDFRNFFKPDKEKQPFAVGDALTRVLSLVRANFENSGITLTVQDTEAGVVTGYANEYSQALLNIVVNAKDALLERKTKKPTIELRCFRSGDKSVVTVHDNAGGIDDAIIDKIFDPYFTTKDKTQGTGIGLYMAKMIIEKNMGGSLTVSNVDNGAEFRIEV